METLSNLINIINSDKKAIKENWIVFKKEAKECIREFKNKETRKKQIPNALTASRLFAPLFIVPAALSGNLILTMIFASSFALTDALDGYYARKYNSMSEFGRELDPITDKLFAGSLLFPLVITNPILSINILLENVIAGINMHSRLNNNKPRTSYVGKVKTAALSITMILSYINMIVKVPVGLTNFLISSTCILQVVTAKVYYNKYKKDEEIKKEVLEEEKNRNSLDIIKEVDNKEKTNEKEISNNTLPVNNKIDIGFNEKIKMLNNLKSELTYTEEKEAPIEYRK